MIDSLEITNQLAEEKILKSHGIPLLILQSEKEMFVSNKSQNYFCEDHPACCHIKKVAGKHEIFMETDLLRDQAIEMAAEFFLDSKKYQSKCRLRKVKDFYF